MLTCSIGVVIRRKARVTGDQQFLQHVRIANRLGSAVALPRPDACLVGDAGAGRWIRDHRGDHLRGVADAGSMGPAGDADHPAYALPASVTRAWRNIPERGGALLVSNHVSYLGWIPGGGPPTERPHPVYGVENPSLTSSSGAGFLRALKAIPVPDGLRGVKAAIEGARRELGAGHLVCIFAEGAINAQQADFCPSSAAWSAWWRGWTCR